MHIENIGGMSRPGGITISSDKYVSSASCNISKWTGEPTFTCEVEKNPEMVPVLRKLRNWPIPRVLYLLIFIWVNGGIAMKIITGVIILSYIPSIPDVTIKVPLLVALALPLAMIAVPLWFVRKCIATWHAAEHMAIACFERHQSYAVSKIAKESPIHNKCGGRLALPLIGAGILCLCLDVFRPTGVNSGILDLLSLEIVLWIDHLWGYENIPGFSHASTWLQRYVTTKKPGQNELRTAALAMEKLVAAHQAA